MQGPAEDPAIGASVAPWGCANTPLLPLAIRQASGDGVILRLSGLQFTPKDLDATFWKRVEVHREGVPPESLLQLKEHSRSLLETVAKTSIAPASLSKCTISLFSLPLRTRTHNALAAQNLRTVKQVAELKYGELLTIPQFGMISLLDLTCCLESIADQITSSQSTESDRRSATSSAPNSKSVSQFDDFMANLSAWAAGERGCKTLGAAFLVDIEEWPPALRTEWTRLLSEDTRTLGGGLLSQFDSKQLVKELLVVFDDREVMVLRARILPSTVSATLEDLGQKAGVTRERIRQIETKVEKRLTNRLHLPLFESLRRQAETLRVALGSAVPVGAMQPRLSELNQKYRAEDPDWAVILEVLLWMAGPYVLRNEWFVQDQTLWERSEDQLNGVLSDGILLRAADAWTVLAGLGIVERHRSDWIETLGGFRKVDEGWIKFGGSLVAKCISWIRYRREPVLVSELARITETDSERSLRNRLLDDARFKRIDKQGHIALREWKQFDEYAGIAQEIAEEITRLGGAAELEHLVSVLTTRYGVRPSSVKMYAAAPMFIRAQDGKIRLRASDQQLIANDDPADCAGCYFVDGTWQFRFEVTQDTLRGSGRAVPPGFSVIAGCQPGQRVSYRSELGDIVLSWPETTASGPSLGSVRAHAEAVRASLGDFLFVGFADSRAVVRLLSQSDLRNAGGPLERLWLLVGLDPSSLRTARNIWEEIALAIGLGEDAENASPDVVSNALNGRGERELVELMPEGRQAETTDAALGRIARLLD